MPKKHLVILFFSLCAVLNKGFAQLQHYEASSNIVRNWQADRIHNGLLFTAHLKTVQFSLFQAPALDLREPATSCVIPKWSENKLAFFCKIEHRMGKKMSVPLKFRLGSVQYVDYLESKPGANWSGY